MQKRSYDFYGFAGAFIVLSAVVALWAGNQVRGGTQPVSPSAAASQAANTALVSSSTDGSAGAQAHGQSTSAQPEANSQTASSQPQTMGETNLQSHAQAPVQGQASAGQSTVSATTVAWGTSYEDAVHRARAEGKPLLVDFYTTWCVYCKKMDAEVYSKPDIIASTGNFVCVKVNAEQRRDLAGAYGVTGFPTIVFVRPQSKGITLLGSLPGYVDASQFAQVLSDAQTQYQKAGVQNA